MNLKNLYPTIVLVSAALFFAYYITHDLMGHNESRLHVLVEAAVFVAVSTVHFLELRRSGVTDGCIGMFHTTGEAAVAAYPCTQLRTQAVSNK